MSSRTFVAVALGGALGAPARYLVGQLGPVERGQFPWSTLVINTTGSLLLGVVLVVLVERRRDVAGTLRPFLASGFLGAYTTYSTFAVEAVMLVRDDRPAVAVASVVSSTLAGVLAVWVGMALARRRAHRATRPS